MNLQPSKLSVAANQVWEESNCLFKKDDVKVDLGLEKTLNKSSTSAAKNKDVFNPGYIFGSQLSARVAKPEEKNKTAEQSEKSEKPTDISSIFKKMAGKGTTQNLWKTTPASTVDDVSTSDRLKASIEELEKKSQSGAELNSTEPVTTGEENEEIIANISCKFFHYNMETKTWVERGSGVFKINQNKSSSNESCETKIVEHIRLVGRTTSSKKVIINSKIFHGMVLEQLSEKRLKISAQNPDSELPQLYIIHSSPASIVTIEDLLRRYIAVASDLHTTLETSTRARKRKPDDEGNDNSDDELEVTKKFIPSNEDDEDRSSS